MRWSPVFGQLLKEFSELIVLLNILCQEVPVVIIRLWGLRNFREVKIHRPARRIGRCWRANPSACAGQRNEGEARSRIGLPLLI
jgi:hypothetical protein